MMMNQDQEQNNENDSKSLVNIYLGYIDPGIKIEI